MLYRPSFSPDYRSGIELIGCSNILCSAHLPADKKHHLNAIGVVDPFPAATQGLQEQLGLQRSCTGLDVRVADPAIDIATLPKTWFINYSKKTLSAASANWPSPSGITSRIQSWRDRAGDNF